ncbi:MAG: hypothetical protein IT158_03700 [Bryobacterales bacterium]|nr:hypothetical protein [Bryobacterales bacterium]
MRKRLIFLITFTAVAVLLSAYFMAFAKPMDKVAICHYNADMDDGDDLWVAIVVAASAMDAHLAHGDFLIDDLTPCPPPAAP